MSRMARWVICATVTAGLVVGPAFAQQSNTSKDSTQAKAKSSTTPPPKPKIVDAPPPTRPAGPQDFTQWLVRIEPDEAATQRGEKPFDDVLTFKGGGFMSNALAQRGFSPTLYTVKFTPGSSSSFIAEQSSQNDGTAAWSGQTIGQNIQGALVWTKKDGTVLKFQVSGERKSADRPGRIEKPAPKP